MPPRRIGWRIGEMHFGHGDLGPSPKPHRQHGKTLVEARLAARADDLWFGP